MQSVREGFSESGEVRSSRVLLQDMEGAFGARARSSAGGARVGATCCLPCLPSFHVWGHHEP
jgi:hypothetical protein